MFFESNLCLEALEVSLDGGIEITVGCFPMTMNDDSAHEWPRGSCLKVIEGQP